ncbi:MPN499 family protein [Mycoplasma sp. 'Moose RK']|uniref:MPN499 family protein n=1 Tax=Mycoplasma sp. 'Moose RK' TaxID=2780095 RepID=UPI001E4FDCB1|nr:hypothetical protein [Mycoplasma sp. 'Moose RK']
MNMINNLQAFLQKTKKVKINHLSDGYWLVPPFFAFLSPRQTKNVIKKANSLPELVQINNFLEKEIIFSFNGDHHFKNFNLAMKLRKIDFRLDFNSILQKPDNATIEFYPVKDCKIILDKPGLTLIYNGIIPFFSREYYQKMLEFQQKLAKKNNLETKFLGFLWRRFGFKELYQKTNPN